MYQLKNFECIKNKITAISNSIKIIAVTKGQPMEIIQPIIKTGHLHYGENRVQEAMVKWKNIIAVNTNINLHLIGHLQTNKVKEAVNLFNYIHTLDSEKLAKLLSAEEEKKNKRIKYFIQINMGNETQKTGIKVEHVSAFKEYCLNSLKLNVIGLMCIPPAKGDPSFFFNKLLAIAKEENLSELSMGMSDDYETATQYGTTYLRIGRAIFSEHSQ